MPDAPAQSVVAPVMGPDATGGEFTIIVREEGSLVSQALEAMTLMLPPLEFAVASMEFVVDVPVHPLGNVQM